jgi:hypothetical protein
MTDIEEINPIKLTVDITKIIVRASRHKRLKQKVKLLQLSSTITNFKIRLILFPFPTELMFI